MAEDSNLQTITITVSGIPKRLLAEVEALAKGERRNRSNYIVKTIEEAARAARKGKGK